MAISYKDAITGPIDLNKSFQELRLVMTEWVLKNSEFVN